MSEINLKSTGGTDSNIFWRETVSLKRLDAHLLWRCKNAKTLTFECLKYFWWIIGIVKS